MPDRHLHGTRRHRQLGGAGGLEVAVFEGALTAVERLVGVAPSIVGRVRSPVGAGHRDPGGQRTPATVDHLHAQPPHGPVVAAPGGEDPLPPSPRHVDHPERGVTTFVRDVRDPPAVVRPARRRGIELPVGERKHVAPLAGHEPQLIPLTAHVGAVNDAGAVGGPVGVGFPRGFLVADLAQRRTGGRRHAPEAAAAVDMPAIGDEDQLPPVGRPGGRQIVIPRAVVIARQLAVVVLCEPGGFAGRAAIHRRREYVPAAVIRGGDECDAVAVGRPARLHVHRAVGRDGPHRARRQVQQVQLDGVFRVAGEDDETSVRRPVGLIVVPGVPGDLDRHARADLLAPQRALHRVDQIAPVGRPRDRAGTARHLRHVHLAPVVGVRHGDLLEHGLPLGDGDHRNESDA